MAAKKGRGLLMVYVDMPAELEDEFNIWYDEEHIPERLALPGVLNAARYVAQQGGPKYLACYELDQPEVYFSDPWKKLGENPSEGTKRLSPSIAGSNFILNLYRMIYPDTLSEESLQAEMSPTILVGRMSVPPDLEETFNHTYNTERLPECHKVPGYIRNRRFEAIQGQPKYTTVHEMQSPAVAGTPEWDAWRTMETPVWNSQIRPHMVHESGSPGVYQRIFPA